MDETTQNEAYGVAVADVSVLTSRPEDGEHGARRAAWGLAALLGTMFLGNVDVAIANVAGPSIRSGIQLGFGGRARARAHLALAATVLAAAAMAAVSVRQR